MESVHRDFLRAAGFAAAQQYLRFLVWFLNYMFAALVVWMEFIIRINMQYVTVKQFKTLQMHAIVHMLLKSLFRCRYQESESLNDYCVYK